jgi:MinD superfamily P-loop ATPase
MKIAVLSGKGGTGKTTVAASMAISLAPCQYIDCDVEEPNGYIFLNPEIQESLPVKVFVPTVDMTECDGCGRCGKVCQFNAIGVVKGKVLVFPEICHHCGACIIACAKGAIREEYRTIGVIETNKNKTFLHGKLNVGEPVAVPVIRELKRHMRDDIPVILDCPPGASCSVVSAIEGCDYCILVAEPTPFGLHDVEIAAKLIKKMNIPCGIVINKASEDNRIIYEFCKAENIEVLMEIPFSQEIAQNYSKGFLPVHNSESWKIKFKELYTKIKRSANN